MTIPSFVRRTGWLVPAVLVLSLAACRPARNPLEPAEGEQVAAAPGDAIKDTVEGVEVSAASNAWSGSPDVLEHVTPLRVTIRNDSGEPVRVHLSEMRLVDPTGKVYAALPLYLVNGQAEIERHVYVPNPGFGYDGYFVDGPYGSYYPGIGVYDYGYPYDYYGYYDYARYYTYWDTVPLPTQRMVDLAVPEGVVDTGGYVSGFVYFERVDPEASSQATFQLDLVNAQSGNRMGQVDLRFDVVG